MTAAGELEKYGHGCLACTVNAAQRLSKSLQQINTGLVITDKDATVIIMKIH